MLGHSMYAFTADVHASLFEEVAAASAEAAEQFVPRTNEKTAGHTSGTPGPRLTPRQSRWNASTDRVTRGC
ncbi:hypothetical protein ACWGR4_14575 [Embleya sp. NPDC055664]